MLTTRAAHRVLKADPVMAGLIAAAVRYQPDQRLRQTPFEVLARAIAHQQLHATAANNILQRFVALFEGAAFPLPQHVIDTDAVRLRAVGFSHSKIAALKDLAAKTAQGVVPERAELDTLSDEQIIERVTQVRGIGRWTVQMMLMFQLQRPDVLPVDDFGVRKGFQLAYGLKGMPTPKALAAFGERWKPYRSLAAWYLWRANDLAKQNLLPKSGRAPRIELQPTPAKKKAARRSRAGVAAALAAVLLTSACQQLKPAAPSTPPAAGTLQTGHHAMVVAANPLAAQAGLNVLRAGGSAADAAVAVQAVLGLVEPQSSSLAGGAFISFYEARSKRVTSYIGRETAPAAATPELFLDQDKKPLPFFTAVLSGRSTGIPGAIAALSLLQHEHGKLAWRALFADGERLATDGFIVSPRLAMMIASRAPQASAADAVHYFSKPDGTRLGAGDLLRNEAYAASLRRIAAQGVAGLLRGATAQDIVNRVHEGDLPGSLSLEDLANYRAFETEAVCRDWQHYRVCTPPPPSGGVSVLETLALLSHTDIAARNANDPVAWAELGEAQRLMYADRNRYIGDPAFIQVPVQGLLDETYIRDRSTLIGTRIAANPPQAGHPPGAPEWGPDHTPEPGGTSNLIIVDSDGNVVCMTTTVESIFGSGRMVDGFFLNNQLTDFSFAPLDADGHPAANAVAAGKRPRSAMAPTIVLDSQGRFVAAAGSAGGPAIIAYIVKTLIGAFDWHLSMQDAISLPNLVAHGANFSGEAQKFQPGLLQQLNALGVDVRPGQFEESGLTAVRIEADGTLRGGADPRREGVALAY